MSQGCSGRSDGDGIRRSRAALRVVDVLALGASPTFAIMALLTGVMGGGSTGMSRTAHAYSISGMVMMYLLMCAFHAGAWLKLIREKPDEDDEPSVSRTIASR